MWQSGFCLQFKSSRNATRISKERPCQQSKGLSFLSKEALREREPIVRGYEALLVPEEGIADYKEVIHKLIELIKQFGAEVNFNTPVFRIEQMINGKVRIVARE